MWDLHESYLKSSVHERNSLIFRGGVLSGMILQVPEKVGPYYIVINGVRKTPYKWPEINTLPETNSSPLKIGLPNRKVVFQPSIFRGYVSFREGRFQVGLFHPFPSGFKRSKSRKLPWETLKVVVLYPIADPWDWYIYLHIPYKSTKCSEISLNYAPIPSVSGFGLWVLGTLLNNESHRV